MMLDELQPAEQAGVSLPTAPAGLPPRAVTANLTLQLRAATRDAEVAEEAEMSANAEVARLELRDRLTPMLEDRRRQLHEVLVEAHADAVTRVDDAHRQAAEKNAADVVLAWAPPAPTPSADDLLASLSSSNVTSSDTSSDTSDLSSRESSSLDPQEMATLFRKFDERLERLVPAPVPKKPSFWKHVFHPDVVIVGLIMIFCLVVVASWMS